ncbi:MAG: hypothetical protein V2I40_04995 [Desulfobacteraceae bacterium]|jgi:hypothetical protein|nr:hypothetical protein [Desulfobacteraceae bacterium]
MKKILTFVAALMLAMSTMVYAGGDKNCGSKGQGSTGSSGGGTVTQNRGGAG